MLYKNNKFKKSAPTWNKEFELTDGSYSVSDIYGYLEYIIKKHQKLASNSPVTIYINKTENRITFKLKRGYYLELSTPETVNLLGSTKNEINKYENGRNMLI